MFDVIAKRRGRLFCFWHYWHKQDVGHHVAVPTICQVRSPGGVFTSTMSIVMHVTVQCTIHKYKSDSDDRAVLLKPILYRSK